jgi:dTDP-4-dehydrorhamnose reductase
MILLLGATGYIGSEFVRAMDRRHIKGYVWHRYPGYDYRMPSVLRQTIAETGATVIINCAAFVKEGVVDKCEDDKAQTLMVNLAFPVMLAEVCQSLNITLLHVSTGCLFNGDNGGKGWSETDEPQLSFNTKCGVYVGAKELAERFVRQYEKHYICRIRLPFDRFDHHRNYISKLQYYPKVVRATNSLSHRGDFVNACLDLLKLKAPFGTYNVTNPGHASSDGLCEWIREILNLDRKFEFWDDKEFMEKVARTPKSNCILNVDKLLATGVKMRSCAEAVSDSLKHWLVETVI